MRKLLALLISASLMLSLVACGDSGNINDTDEQNQDVSQGAQTEMNDDNADGIDLDAYRAVREPGDLASSISQSGEYMQFTITNEALGMFIADVNDGYNGDFQFYFDDRNDEWGTLFLYGEDGKFSATFDYIHEFLKTENDDFSIDLTDDSLIVTLKASEDFDLNNLISIGYNLNVDDTNVYSLEMVGPFDVTEVDFIGEDSESDDVEDVPEYIDISIYDYEWKLAPDSNNSDVITVRHDSDSNLLSLTIPTGPNSSKAYHGYYAHEITGPDGLKYSYFTNVPIEDKEYITDAYALKLNDAGDELYFYDMIKDEESSDFAIDLSSKTTYYKLVRTDYEANDDTQVTITPSADTLAFTISGSAARAYFDKIADQENNPIIQLRLSVDFKLNFETESGDAQSMFIEYNETTDSHYIMVNHLAFFDDNGVKNSTHRVLTNDEEVINLNMTDDSITISYPLYQKDDYSAYDQMYFDETTYGDTVHVHLFNIGDPVLYDKELPFTVVK